MFKTETHSEIRKEGNMNRERQIETEREDERGGRKRGSTVREEERERKKRRKGESGQRKRAVGTVGKERDLEK